MRSRLELQALLIEAISPHVSSTTKRVAFDPDVNTELVYPCIVYELSNDWKSYADNDKYRRMRRYTITVIDSNPDSRIPEELEKIRYCAFDRAFVSDNMHHWVYTLFF